MNLPDTNGSPKMKRSQAELLIAECLIEPHHPDDALKEAEEEAKALKSANAKKAAAARWGSKTKQVAEAEKALGLGDRFIGGLRALGETRGIKPIAEFAKGALEMFHKEGGEQKDYSGTYYQGTYFQGGGSYNPTSVNYGDMLPQFAMGYNIPEAMYGMGMAYGGAPCYNCGGMYAQGGLVKGSVHDMSESDIQNLINQGYKIEYL